MTAMVNDATISDGLIVKSGQEVWVNFTFKPGLFKKLAPCRIRGHLAGFNCPARHLRKQIWKIRLVEDEEPVFPSGVDQRFFNDLRRHAINRTE